LKNNKYSIIVSSLTGNTKMLADAIYDVLPKENCDFYGDVKTQIPLKCFISVFGRTREVPTVIR